MRDGEIAAPENARNVEHGIIGEDHIVARVRHDDRIGPALVGKAPVRELHQLGRSRGPAGMHIGGNVIGLDRVLEQQTVAGLTRGERVEVRFRMTAPPGPGTVRMCTAERSRADRLHVLPDLIAGVGPSVTTAFGLVARTRLGQQLRLEHPVDAAGDARSDRAHHHDVELRHRRQHVHHHVVRGHAERVEEIGRLDGARSQFAIANRDRFAVRIAVGDVADGDLVRIEHASAGDPIVQIPGEDPAHRAARARALRHLATFEAARRPSALACRP